MKNLFLIVVFGLTLMVESFPQEFSTGKIGVTLSGAGRVRVYKDSTAGVRQIDRSSILVGTGSNAVFGYNQDAQNVDPVVSIQNPQLVILKYMVQLIILTKINSLIPLAIFVCRRSNTALA